MEVSFEKKKVQIGDTKETVEKLYINKVIEPERTIVVPAEVVSRPANQLDKKEFAKIYRDRESR